MMSFPPRKALVWAIGLVCLMMTSQMFFTEHSCPDVLLPEGAASGLVARMRPVKADRYDLGRVGLQPEGEAAVRGGLSLEMVSEANHTQHRWYWPETYEILQKCGKEQWAVGVPNVSVIITFIDQENVSTLLHTVHSVMQRTPTHLLHELILIADNSKRDDLGEMLDIYVNTVFSTKVRLFRSTRVMGLIQARLKGIRMARGDVVISMDSHVEVQPGWIEPLLHEIEKNPKTLAASNLDWMQKDNNGVWEYKHAGSLWKTYFDWSMVFGFQTMSDSESKARKSMTEAIESPVTIGTVFAMKKSWFTEIGEFDSGMELWGGENLDLPLRVWMCGGRVINVPCSRVAHLEYAHNRDYRSSWNNVIHRNYKRFALVWMDDYIKYFYQYFPEMESEDVGSVADRRELRNKCPHDFQWFLDTVFPQLGLPQEHGLAYDGLQNLGSALCLDTMYSMQPGMADCGHGAQLSGFYWSMELEIRMPMHVFNIQSKVESGKRKYSLNQDEYMSHYKHPEKISHFIHWENGPIIAFDQNLCLESVHLREALLKPCDLNNRNQLWRFQTYSQDYTDIVAGQSDKFAHITKSINFWKEVKLKVPHPKTQPEEVKVHVVKEEVKDEVKEEVKEGGKESKKQSSPVPSTSRRLAVLLTKKKKPSKNQRRWQRSKQGVKEGVKEGVKGV